MEQAGLRGGAASGSERSLMLRRSRNPASRSRVRREDPREGYGGQAARVPSQAAGVPYSGDEPQVLAILSLPGTVPQPGKVRPGGADFLEALAYVRAESTY